MRKHQVCSACRYFKQTDGQAGGVVKAMETLAVKEEPNTSVGECRRNAPRPETADREIGDTDSGSWPVTFWPKVAGTDWCGEWASRETAL